jgi:hypothetical protein
MPRPEDGFVLVVRVWLHDGVPVARLLAHPPNGPAVDEGTTVAGTEEIVTTVQRWVRDLVTDTLGGAPHPPPGSRRVDGSADLPGDDPPAVGPSES